MRLFFTLVVVLALALAGNGCSGDPYEGAAEKFVAKAKDVAAIVQGVKTEADADAANRRLAALALDFDEIAASLSKQSKMSESQKKKISAVTDKARQDLEKLRVEKLQIGDPKVLAKLTPALERVRASMAPLAEKLEIKGM